MEIAHRQTLSIRRAGVSHGALVHADGRNLLSGAIEARLAVVARDDFDDGLRTVAVVAEVLCVLELAHGGEGRGGEAADLQEAEGRGVVAAVAWWSTGV